MGTRISFSSINTRILDRLHQNYGKLEDVQQQLASGKKVDRPSDDPVAVSNSMEMRTQIDQFKTFQRNIDDGLAYLGTVDTTMSTGNSLYQNMRERAIQASNDTNSADSRHLHRPRDPRDVRPDGGPLQHLLQGRVHLLRQQHPGRPLRIPQRQDRGVRHPRRGRQRPADGRRHRDRRSHQAPLGQERHRFHPSPAATPRPTRSFPGPSSARA